MSSYYLDSSAAFKLVSTEPESRALAAFLEPAHRMVTSRLTVLEVGRALRRTDPSREALLRLRTVWCGFVVIGFSSAILIAAEQLDPPVLRSLDAIQLATALSLGTDIDGFVAYDARLLAAAEAMTLPNFSPG